MEPKTRLSTRLFPGFAVLGVLLGIYVRVLGYFDGSNAMWWDEGSWVRKIEQGEYGIRPLGYASLSHLLIEIDPTEMVVRAPSLFFGILTLPAFVLLGRTLRLSNLAVLFGLFVLALHPWAIAYSKEFKPYATELFAHITLLTATAAYFQKPSKARLVVVVVTALGAALLAWTAGALLPAILGVVLLTQYRAQDRKQLKWTLVGTGVAALAAGAFYFKLVRGRSSSASFWAKKYGVFTESTDPVERLSWTVEKTLDLARLPLDLHSSFLTTEGISIYFGGLALLLIAFGGLVAVVERRWDWLLLGASPWCVVIVANALSLWPYGVFRTNLFLLIYPLLWICFALSWLSGGDDDAVRSTWLDRLRAHRIAGVSVSQGLAGAVLLALLPFVPLDTRYYRIKDERTGAEATSMPRIIEVLDRHIATLQPEEKPWVFLDRHACASFNYYRIYDPRYQATGRALRREFRVVCGVQEDEVLERRLRRLARTEGFWFASSNTAIAKRYVQFLEPLCDYDPMLHYETGDVLVRCRPLDSKRNTVSASPAP